MSQETLSALLDGECSPEELDALLDALETSPQLKSQWSRLCSAQDARAGVRLKPLGSDDFCAAVMAGIAAEPAPQRSHTVVPLPVRNKRVLPWRRLAGLALAASVAAVAVTLGFNFGKVGDTGTSGEAQIVDGGALQTVAMENPGAVDDDLRNYLLEHSNTLADRGVGGALSYARFAARTGDAAFAQPASLTTYDGGSQQ